jgi:hypothetical protein
LVGYHFIHRNLKLSHDEQIRPAERLKVVLVVVGILLLVIGAVALTYAVWPTPINQLQETLSPTLFLSPP